MYSPRLCYINLWFAMTVLKNKEALLTYLKQRCKTILNPQPNDIELSIALGRQLVMHSVAWEQLSEAVFASNFDPSEKINSASPARARGLKHVQGLLDQFLPHIVSDINKERSIPSNQHSTPERLMKEYFFPMLFKQRSASMDFIHQVDGKLSQDKESEELQQYKRLLTGYVDYVDAVSTLPFALEKLINALHHNSTKNYTPKQNAQVIASLLEVLKKNKEKNWNAKKLLKTLKFVAKVSMLELPADALTLESVSELLPHVNQIISKSQLLDREKAAFFSENDVQQREARKALFSTMGVDFVSLTTLFQDTLFKPVEDALQVGGNLLQTASSISTEDGLDYFQMLNTLDQAGHVVNNFPVELMPSSLRSCGHYYSIAKKTADKVTDYMAGKAGQVLSTAVHYTPESVKTKADDLLGKTAEVTLKVHPTAQKVASVLEYLTPYHYTPYLPKQTFRAVTNKILGVASSCVSDSTKKKFKQPDPEAIFWQSVQPSEAVDPHIEAYFHFYNLAKAANIPLLEKELFEAFVKKEGVEIAYNRYLDFKSSFNLKTFNSPLKIQLELFQHFVESDEEENQDSAFGMALFLVQRTKTLETQIKCSQDPNALLEELHDALDYESDHPKIADFKSLYIRPALEKCLLHCEQQLMPKLEEALDAGYEQFRSTYSRLKAGQSLSPAEVRAYSEECLTLSRQEIVPPLDAYVENLTILFPPKQQGTPVPKALTPKEESRRSIQSALECVHPLFAHIAEGLNQQQESCQGLLALCPQDPLKSLCEAKIRYLQSLNQAIKKIMEDISIDDNFSEQIRQLISGENLANLSETADARMIAKQFMSLGLVTLLPKSKLVKATTPEKILAYALKRNNHLQNIVEAKKQFDQKLKVTPPPPELLKLLGNPLQVQVKSEETVRTAVAATLAGVATPLVQSYATYYAMGAALGCVFPQALIVDVALGVLIRSSVQEKIGGYLQPVTQHFKGLREAASQLASKQRDKLIDPIKDWICPKLQIEVQKVLQEKAYDYAVGTDKSHHGRDSFSGLYLQYRAIKDNNPDMAIRDISACVKYLFKEFLKDKDEKTRKKIVSAMRDQFFRLDLDLKVSGKSPNLDSDLDHAMAQVNFDAPTKKDSMIMVLYNRRLMMQFEATRLASSKEEARRIQGQAMAALRSLSERLSRDQKRDVSGSRAQELVPAIKQAEKMKLMALQEELLEVTKLIGHRIKDREEQLKADQNPEEAKRLGRLIFVAKIAKASRSGLIADSLQFVYNLKLSTKFWSILSLVVLAEKGFLTGLLTFLGIAGGTAGSVSTLGLVFLVGVVLLKAVYAIAKEIRGRNDEFEAINQRDISDFKKRALTLLKGLECVGIGLAKAIFFKTLYNKVLYFFNQSTHPIKGTIDIMRNLLVSYPEAQILEIEKGLLEDLQEKCKVFQSLVEAHMKDKDSVDYDLSRPEKSRLALPGSYEARLRDYDKREADANEIAQKSVELSRCLRETEDFLARSSKGDARWKKGVNQELELYKTAFVRLNEVMLDLGIVRDVEKKMQPQQALQNQVMNDAPVVEAAAVPSEAPKKAQGSKFFRLFSSKARVPDQDAIRQAELMARP